MTVSILSSHRVVHPFGLHGGEPGQVGQNSLKLHLNDQFKPLSAKVNLKVQCGDCLTIKTPGGGGYDSFLFPSVNPDFKVIAG